MKYSHQDVRRVESERIKLRKEAADQRQIYDDHDDPASDDAQEALRKMRAIEVDLDKAEEEAAEVRAQVAERNELLLREARNMQYEMDRRTGRLPAGIPGQLFDDSDPNAPTMGMLGSSDPAEDQAFREAFWNQLRDQIPQEQRGHRTFVTAENREILAKVEKRVLVSTATADDKAGNTIPKQFSGHLEEFLKFSGPCVPGGALCYEFNTPTGVDYSVMTVDDTAEEGETITEAKRGTVTSSNAGTDSIGAGNDPKFNRVTFQG